MSRFALSRPFRGVFHLQFPMREGMLGDVDMAFHFLRFQEHYESPGFKGTVFGWADYVRWYKKVRGEFSYPWDWGGYNFPGGILTPFRQGRFDPLTSREKALLAALKDVGPGDYVIGTYEGDDEGLAHELAHAFWFLDADYQREVRAILAGGDFGAQEAALAAGEGYDRQVFLDEIQACAVDGAPEHAPDKERAAAIRAAFERVRKEREA
jgi:hypothetical protein